MNSEVPSIKVSKQPLSNKTINDLNKVSSILFKTNIAGGGNKKKRSKTCKTRKIKRN
jgi:hypothetical protein